MAAALLQEISQDERERAILRSRRMYETDMTSNLLTAKRKGEIEGEIRGREEGIKQVAKKMKSKGIDLLTISETTSLSVDEVLQL